MSSKFILALCLVTSSSLVMGDQVIETLGCILEPSKKIKISSPVASVIESIPVKRGDIIKKGQLLIELQSGVQQATVNLALVKAGFSERNKNRNIKLYGDDLLSSHERDEIETEYLVATMELNAAQEELSLRKVYSSVNGVVIDKNNNAGEYVTTEPVLELAVLNPLFVEVLMPYERFGDFKTTDTITVTLAEPVQGSYQAVVKIIDPIIDSASGTFRMRMELANDNYQIPAGIRCKISRD